MKTLYTFLFIALLGLSCGKAVAQQVSEGDRTRYVTEIRNYKHKHIAKELDLTKEQQAKFFPFYDRMEDSIMVIGDKARTLEQVLDPQFEATDQELEAVAETLFNQKLDEGRLEAEYYNQFKQILTPRQLIALKVAERSFNQRLMRQHARLRGERGDRGDRPDRRPDSDNRRPNREDQKRK